MTIYSSTSQSVATSCDEINLVYSVLIPCPNNARTQWIQACLKRKELLLH